MTNKFNKVAISSLTEILSGGTPKRNEKEYWGGEIPWASAKDVVSNGRLLLDTAECITQKGLDSCAAQLLRPLDIIVTARGTVGALAQVVNPVAVNQSCYALRPQIDRVDPNYLYYAIQNSVKEMKQVAHGSVFDTITRSTFDSLEVFLPNLSYQKQIAAVLSALDERAESGYRQISKLKTISSVLLKQDTEDADAAWPSVTLGDVSLWSSGSSLAADRRSPAGSYPIAGAAGPIGKSDFFNHTDSTITVGRVGSCGKVTYYRSSIWASDNVLIVKSNGKIKERVLCQMLEAINFRSAISGSTQPLLTQSAAKKLEIKIPPEDIQIQTDRLLKEADRILDFCHKLEELRDFLLPRLVEGQLTVSDLVSSEHPMKVNK